jgi:hypothetical protein
MTLAAVCGKAVDENGSHRRHLVACVDRVASVVELVWRVNEVRTIVVRER